MQDDIEPYQGSGQTRGYRALFLKKVPLDGAVIIRAMLAWVASRPALSSEASPIYVVASPGQPMRLVNGDSDATVFAHAKLRLVLADRSLSQVESPENQRMFCPRHLYRLGHLLSCFKYAVPGSLIEPSTNNKHYQLHFQPSEFITGRLGLSLSGSAYDLLESDLATLATTMVHLQERQPTGEWRTRHSYPLIQHLDTGKVRSEGGRNTKAPQARRRQYWNIELGQPLVAMLSTAPTELSVMMPTAWNTTGKNPTAQWLSLFAESHGYNGRLVFDHNIGTLLQRTRLTQKGAKKLVDHLSRRADRAPATHTSPSTLDLFTPTEPVMKPTPSSSLLANLKQHAKQLRNGVRRLRTAVDRLSDGGMYQRCELSSHSDQPDPPSTSRRHVMTTLFAKFRLMHWPAMLHQALQRLPVLIRQRASGLLASLPADALSSHAEELSRCLPYRHALFHIMLVLRRRYQLLSVQRLTPV